MAIVTFWSERKKEVGQTATAIAIATQMAIEHNYKILLISTNNVKELEKAFWDSEKKRRGLAGIFENTKKVNIDSGIQGVVKAAISNKLTPEIITNYTRIVLKDRLEVMDGYGGEEYETIYEQYPEIILNASKYYDLVMVDLNREIQNEFTERILKHSDVIVYGINQNKASVEEYMKSKNEGFLNNKKNIVNYIGRYDRFSKYNSKNIARYLKTGKDMCHLSYNTLLNDCCDEGTVAELFLNLKPMKSDDKSIVFYNEVKQLSESIIYKIQELELRI